MGKYKKCPRCDLNYIPTDEDMCDVCKAELGLDTSIVLLDDIIDDDEPLKLCPVCKTAYIGMDEDMCENCLAHESGSVEEVEDDDDWRSYLDDEDTKDTDEGDIISFDELEADEEFDDEDDFEDEENLEVELDDYPDDFDEEFSDDFDDDFEDEDEEEEEDED